MLPQPRGEPRRDVVAKLDDVLNKGGEKRGYRRTGRGTSAKKVRDPFAPVASEDNVYQFLVKFGVRDTAGFRIPQSGPWLEVTEIDFQREKEKSLPVSITLAIPQYHFTPSTCHYRQLRGPIL